MLKLVWDDAAGVADASSRMIVASGIVSHNLAGGRCYLDVRVGDEMTRLGLCCWLHCSALEAGLISGALPYCPILPLDILGLRLYIGRILGYIWLSRGPQLGGVIKRLG